MDTPSIPPTQPEPPRRQLDGSWLDWIGALSKTAFRHQGELPAILRAAQEVRGLMSAFGPDHAMTHRAQALLLVSARPEELFTLLAEVAQELLGEEEA